MFKKAVLTGAAFIMGFTLAFAVGVAARNDDDEGIARPVIKGIEKALERLEKFEERKFKTDEFERGSVPQTISINPQGQIRITRGTVTAAATSSDTITVEAWKLSFTVHKMPDTKVAGGKKDEISFGDIKVGDIVSVVGRLDANTAAFVHAEVIHNHTQVIRGRDEEVSKLRAKINELIERLNELLRKVGQSPVSTSTATSTSP